MHTQLRRSIESPRRCDFRSLLCPLDSSRIDGFACPRNHLEGHQVADNFSEHESVVSIEAFFRQFRFPDIAFAQLAAGNDNKIMNGFL